MRTSSKSSAGVALTVALVWFSALSEAHKPITSKFTYNTDLFPVLVNRCSHCHIAGGVGPMSLVAYEDAFPWAESLRAELLDAGSGAEAQPHDPQQNSGSGGSEAEDFVRAAHRQLTARELDMILDWAVGGTPEGDAPKPAPVMLKNDWAGSTPDLVIQPAAPFEIPADLMEVTKEFVLPTNLSGAREISAIDLLPGTPAVVRDATIAVRAPDGSRQRLGPWFPRQVPAVVALGPGTLLPAGADLVATIRYKKTWKYEGQAMTDRSSVGIYFAGK